MVGPEVAASVGPKVAVALGGRAVAAEEAKAPVWRSGWWRPGRWRSRGAFLYLDFYMRHEHIVLPFFARNRLEHFAMN
jgi:hypothetical protein